MKWVVSITIAVAFAVAAMSPVLAAKHAKAPKAKMTGACAQPSGRCVSDCNQLNWCTMYTCVNARDGTYLVSAIRESVATILSASSRRSRWAKQPPSTDRPSGLGGSVRQRWASSRAAGKRPWLI